METMTRLDAMRQKVGGVAALYLALCYIAAMPFFLLVVDYLGATTAAQKVTMVVENYSSMYAMYLATYVVFGFALGVLALALYDRLKASAPSTARVAAAVGLLWAGVLVAYGLIFTYGMTTVVDLAKTDLVQAQVTWRAIETVAMGLGGAGGEILGGLWVLLVSVVALRGGALPKALGWLGMVVGVAGVASVIPPLNGAGIAFGLLQIVWFVWVGVALIATKASAAEQASPARDAAPKLEGRRAGLVSAAGDLDPA